MHLKIDWSSLLVGGKSTVFALFYFVFEGNFLVQPPRGLIFGGAYTWRGLFSEFYTMSLICAYAFLLCQSTTDENSKESTCSYRIIRLTKTLLVPVNRYIDIFSVIHGYKHKYKDLYVRTFIN